MPQPDWTDNDTKVLQVLASVLTSQGKEARAAVLLEYALEHDPRNTAIKKALGGIYTLLERHGDALEMIGDVLSNNPTPADEERLQLVRSDALWKSGRKDEARMAMQHYVSKRKTQ